jgi:hypothetical protein
MDLNALTSAVTPLLLQQIIVVTIGITVLCLVIVLFIKTRRQMRIDKGIRSAQGETDVALRRIKSRLNYTAQLLNNERERAGYDRVRFSDQDARSIAAVLLEAETQYTSCSQRLEVALRTLPKTPDEASYRTVLTVIDELTPLISPIEEALQRGIQLRTGFEARISEHTTHIDEARTAHLALAHRLNALGITVHTMLIPADKHLALAQAALASHRYADIEPDTTRALAIYATFSTLLSQLVDIRDGIASGRIATEKAAVQGFDVSESRALFVEASRRIDAALAALIAADPDTAREHITQAEYMRTSAVERGGSLPALQQRHSERITRLEQQNALFGGLCDTAYQAFESLLGIGIAPIAELTHTGSEAQYHVVTALVCSAYAQSLNTTNPEQYHDIAMAIHTAERASERAQTIYAVLIQRSLDMTHIELLARQEFAACDELIRLWKAQQTEGLRDVRTDPETIHAAFTAAQVAADATPFDALACFHSARILTSLVTPDVRMTTAELAALVTERGERARSMLQRQMNLVEQFMVLFPLAVPPDIERGVLSMRHEVNAFDAAFHTASDLTFPLQSELYRLIQRYDRLNNALQHLQGQLARAHQTYMQELEQCSGLVRALVQRLRQTTDHDSFKIALQRLQELDEQWATRALPRAKILQSVSDIIAHLPPASAHINRSFSPPLALTIRAWGKSCDTTPTDFPGWEPIRNAHPRW